MFKRLSRIFCASLALTSVQVVASEQVSGINNVSFYDAQYNNHFAGNGFLIEYQQKLYAVTVKHALFEAKTPDVDSASIEGHVRQWLIHPNGKSDESVVMGKLLNASEAEKLGMNILQSDWLVFEVSQNNSNLTPLTLRDTPLESGEPVTAYGCSYVNAQTCEQDSYAGSFIESDGNNLRIAMPDLNPGQLRGLSGSPVLDSSNRLVGIVSNVLRSKTGEGFDFAPANLSYLKRVVASL